MIKSSGKTGVLLVNLGTPDSTKTPDVRKYLREFLMDGRVIDIPFVNRWMLINFIIAPFRAPKSAAEYKKLWTDRGSPLLYHTEDLRDKLIEKLDPKSFVVSIGMRYQSPSIEKGLEELREAKVNKIIVLPLFPQYASASTGSVIDKVMEIARGWQVIPDFSFISNFVEQPKFIDAWVERGKAMLEKQDYDKIVFSYHGLPERQILKGSTKGYCQLGSCCNKYGANNYYCYRAQCFQTTRLIVEKLGIPEDKVVNSFQSRLLKDPWVKPYTDEVIAQLAKEGVKKVLAFSPSFIADCLETTVEVGEEYKEMFLEAGGEVWDLVPSLNTEDTWVECVKEMVLEKTGLTPQ